MSSVDQNATKTAKPAGTEAELEAAYRQMLASDSAAMMQAWNALSFEYKKRLEVSQTLKTGLSQGQFDEPVPGAPTADESWTEADESSMRDLQNIVATASTYAGDVLVGKRKFFFDLDAGASAIGGTTADPRVLVTDDGAKLLNGSTGKAIFASYKNPASAPPRTGVLGDYVFAMHPALIAGLAVVALGTAYFSLGQLCDVYRAKLQAGTLHDLNEYMVTLIKAGVPPERAQELITAITESATEHIKAQDDGAAKHDPSTNWLSVAKWVVGGLGIAVLVWGAVSIYQIGKLGGGVVGGRMLPQAA